MSRPAGNKSAPKSGSPMLAGILVGMVVGVALSAGMAWFILKSPSPFVNKDIDIKPTVEIAKRLVETTLKPKTSSTPGVEVNSPSPAGASGASGAAETKPRFEFYKVLTDTNSEAAPKSAEARPADKISESKPSTEARPADKNPEGKLSTKYLQAGAFSSAADAENLKATLAMKGLEANVQTVTLPDKGEIHRVRVGPFQSEQEVSSARGTLKLNGLEARPVH